MIQESHAEPTQQLQIRRLKVQVYSLHEDFWQASSQVFLHRTGGSALLKLFRHFY